MANFEEEYKGFRCTPCGMWFSRSYLFDRHNRDVHNHLGDFIVLPALTPETLLYLSETKKAPFAILHIPKTGNQLLMKLTNVETHCMARIATQEQLLQLYANQDNKADEMIDIPIVLDIYPKRDPKGTVSYRVESRITAKLPQTDPAPDDPPANLPQPPDDPPANLPQPPDDPPATSHMHMKPVASGIGYNADVHLSLPLTMMQSNAGSAYTYSTNPFCDELERLANLL